MWIILHFMRTIKINRMGLEKPFHVVHLEPSPCVVIPAWFGLLANLSLHPLLHNDSAPPPPLPNPCNDLGGCCGCFVFNILPNLSIFSSRLLLLTTFNYLILHKVTWYYIQLKSSISFHSDFRLAASYSRSQQKFHLGDYYNNSF